MRALVLNTVWSIGGLAFVGCAFPDDEVQHFQPIPASVVLDIPLDSVAPDVGMIVQARIRGDGRGIVLLDAVSPHLRVIGPDAVASHFLESGEGPREIDNPIALAVAGDTALVASSNAQLTILNMRTGDIQTRKLSGRAILGIAAGCQESVVTYSPRPRDRADGEWDYVEAVSWEGDSLQRDVVLQDGPPGDQMIAFGRPSGVVGREGNLLIRHDYGEAGLYRSRCAPDGRLALERAGSIAHGMPSISIPPGGGSPGFAKARVLIPAGIARLGQDTTLIASIQIEAGSKGESNTLFELFTSSGIESAMLTGTWILRDSLGEADEAMVLLERGGDHPRLLLISAKGLALALAPLMRTQGT